MDPLEGLILDGSLLPLDVSFARAMGRLGDETRPEVLAAAALTSRRVAEAHVCLDLPRFLRDVARGDAPSSTWKPPELDVWLDSLSSSSIVGGASSSTPLVLDSAGRLYLRRYFELEGRLANTLLERASRPSAEVNVARLERGLARLFPPSGELNSPDLQRAAARMAVERSFAVISGGPGTGKTSTVVKILALLLEQPTADGTAPLRIELLAPTGKARTRLLESIVEAREKLDCDREIIDAIPTQARTIHAALGARVDRPGTFRHRAGNPLPTDLVLVDEASMVDLALMANLLDAIRPDTRVILLGDKHQLASVEAGAVLGDICSAAEGAGGRDESPLSGSILHLEKSWRYAEGSGIAELATAINAGEAGRALEVLTSEEYPDVSLVPPPGDGLPGSTLIRSAVDGYRAYLEAEDLDEKLRELGDHRVLAAHRRGRRGVVGLNEAIARALYAERLIPRFEGHYDGRAVMIRQNDPQLRLSNGDVGLEVVGSDGRLEFVFGVAEEARRFAVNRLPPHESVYAMTIHKSQGSEFRDVSVVLPEEPSPILSRELLYTAVTRASESVRIHGSREVVERAIALRIQRSTGLGDRLRGES